MGTTPEPNWLIQVPDKPGAHMAYNKTHIDVGHMVLKCWRAPPSRPFPMSPESHPL